MLEAENGEYNLITMELRGQSINCPKKLRSKEVMNHSTKPLKKYHSFYNCVITVLHHTS